jgi:hypothetical protein
VGELPADATTTRPLDCAYATDVSTNSLDVSEPQLKLMTFAPCAMA